MSYPGAAGYSVSPGAAPIPRRAFGSQSSLSRPGVLGGAGGGGGPGGQGARPSSAASGHSFNLSSTPTPTGAGSIGAGASGTSPVQHISGQQLFKPETNRTRSASSASSSSDAFLVAAGDKAQSWLGALQTWAPIPKGEGRSREFLAHTLNGVASVASTTLNGVNDAVKDLSVQLRDEGFSPQRGFGRPASFSAASSGGGAGLGVSPNGQLGTSASAENGVGRLGSSPASQWTSPGGTGLRSASSPPPPGGPVHAASAPVLAGSQLARRIPQPSNLARLTSDTARTASSSGSVPGPGTSASRPESATGTGMVGPTPGMPRSASASLAPSMSTSTSMNSLTVPGPHGPSHLRPGTPRAGSAQPTFSSNGADQVPGLGGYPKHARSQSHSYGASPAMSRSSSNTVASGGVLGMGSTRSAGMPYKIGFQPAGVRSDRTAEYMDARRLVTDERDKEEGRLGRRWAKLVDLHFNPTTPAQPAPAPTLSRSSSSSFSLSSMAEKRRSILSMDTLDSLKPKEMWKGIRGVVQDPAQAEEVRKRSVEQSLVKWEDDAEVKKCRICQSSFTLSNRKHHCRLCGRIVCSLQPTAPALLAVQMQLFAPADPSASAQTPSAMTAAPQVALPPGTRREKCSILLVADWKSGRGEEVEEGFVGWMKVGGEADAEAGSPAGGKKGRRKSGANGNPNAVGRIEGISKGQRPEAAPQVIGEDGKPMPQQATEKQVKGVRACRECWAVVSRKQKMADRQRPTGFARLYQLLRGLQAEIEDTMPEFEDEMQELVMPSDPGPPPPSLLVLHKTLLTLFTQYEHLSKRLSSLPAEDGSSQAQLQSAVARVAAAFLAKQMAKVQALPRLQKAMAARERERARQNGTGTVKELTLGDLQDGSGSEPAEDVALVLQPLLEQEAQLESYIADAKAQRKYEDSKALSTALNEIRAEIARIANSAA